MSPRAAWRLEAAGFGPVYDYVDGKSDWLAADLPFEGTARLAGLFTRREVAIASESTPVREALGQVRERGFGPVLVLNHVGALMRFGVSTVRPSEQVAELVHRMRRARVSRVVVTRSDGTLVGLFFADDVPQA
jgi:CBS domain-containing protein